MGQLGCATSQKWVRREDSDRVDDESRPILERVDLMETFFEGVHPTDLNHVFREVLCHERGCEVLGCLCI